jgi:hypothetical protein
MKSKTYFALAFLAAFITAWISSIQMAYAQSLNLNFEVPEISLNMSKIPETRNLFLTVLYANSSSVVSSPTNEPTRKQITLQSVSAQKTISLDGSAIVIIPKQDLRQHSGLIRPNVVVMVIHRGPQLVWKNADGSPTRGVNSTAASSATDILYTDFVYRSQIEQTLRVLNQNVFSYTFGAE